MSIALEHLVCLPLSHVRQLPPRAAQHIRSMLETHFPRESQKVVNPPSPRPMRPGSRIGGQFLPRLATASPGVSVTAAAVPSSSSTNSSPTGSAVRAPVRQSSLSPIGSSGVLPSSPGQTSSRPLSGYAKTSAVPTISPRASTGSSPSSMSFLTRLVGF